MIPGPVTERSSDDADGQIKPSVSVRAPTLGMFVGERERIVNRSNVNVWSPLVV